jgi:hypothetical protein
MDDFTDAQLDDSQCVPISESGISSFLSKLLGCDVRVFADSQQDDWSDGSIAAVFTLEVDRTEAACVFDIRAAAGLAVSASIIPAEKLDEAARGRHLDGVLRQRLRALCEFGGELFAVTPPVAAGRQLTLTQTSDLAELSGEARVLLENPGKRSDFRIHFADGHIGRLTLLTR